MPVRPMKENHKPKDCVSCLHLPHACKCKGRDEHEACKECQEARDEGYAICRAHEKKERATNEAYARSERLRGKDHARYMGVTL